MISNNWTAWLHNSQQKLYSSNSKPMMDYIIRRNEVNNSNNNFNKNNLINIQLLSALPLIQYLKKQ